MASLHADDLRLRAAVESSPNGLLVIDRDGTIVLVNREIERLFGYSREELLGSSVERLIPASFRAHHPGFRASFFTEPQARAMGAGRDLFGVRKDGTEVPVEIGLTPVETEEGLYVVSAIVDISERKRAERDQQRLEAELRQSQKLEAVGRLAGGIAHDFNNILAMIVGFAELAREGVDRVSPQAMAADLDQILAASARGREVVQQLLRFSRPQKVDVHPIALEAVLKEAVSLLRAAVPPGVTIRMLPPAGTAFSALGDPTSVHQVVMNLATNAAHSMPEGGTIEIGFDRFYARDSFVRGHPEISEGEYARLYVRDTGTGMSDEVRERAFEPFFTTKPLGAGTGLGLSMVRGIIRDHGGAVWLESMPGQGTTVHCLLQLSAESQDSAAPVAAELPRGRRERILLVDDERGLTEVTKRRLEALGYDVIAVNDPEAALRLVEVDPRQFDLVVTDYAMPGMTGMQLAHRITAIRATLPVILLTGYLEDFPADELETAGIRRVHVKPVSGALLAQSVHELLEAKAR
jgi:PAS domain S-box-containing protein